MLATDQLLQSWQHLPMADKTHKYLAAWRKSRGLSGEQLAAALGTTKPTISRLETGKMGPKFDWWLEKLAAYYECTVDSLQAAPSNETLNDVAQTQRGKGEKEAGTVRDFRPLAKRLIKKFGDPFIDAVLEEAAPPKEQPPRPPQRQKG